MDNQLCLYDGTYNAAGNDEHVSAEGIWYPCLFFNPNYSQEGFLQGLLSSSCGMEEADHTRSYWNEYEPVEETYEGEAQSPYHSCGDWPSKYRHCWADDYFSLSNGTQNNGDGSELMQVEEDSRQCEQQHDSHTGHEEVTQEPDYPACNSNTWSYDSWFAFGDTDYQVNNKQESRRSHSYYPPEIGVYESIFSYWPCLYRQFDTSVL